jgi:hypothetical protein
MCDALVTLEAVRVTSSEEAWVQAHLSPAAELLHRAIQEVRAARRQGVTSRLARGFVMSKAGGSTSAGSPGIEPGEEPQSSPWRTA